MSAVDLLSSLHFRGVRLRLDGDHIRYTLRSGELTASDLQNIAEHRDEIVRILRVVAETPTPPVAPVARDGRLMQLSFAQQRLWFLAQLEGSSEAYHIPLALHLQGRLDEGSLRRALDRLVWRHEVLRTSFVTRDGEAFQHIGPADQGFALAFQDLSAQPDAQDQLNALRAQEAWSPFDLEHGPLIRGRLVRLGAEEQVLLLTLHHIVSDGWSSGVLTRELGMLYRSYVEGREDPLEPLAIQYADYAAWQRHWLSGEVLAAQAAYWRERLAGAPTLLELPGDRKRPARQDYAGGTVSVELDGELTAGLQRLSRRYGMTLFMTVLAGWALVLSRLSGQDDIVIGAPSANRSRPEIEGLIGFFVNTLALRIDLSGQPTVEQLLRRVKTVALGAQAHQDLPFEQVVELARPARSLTHTPLFQVLFSWQNNPGSAFEFAGLIPRKLAAESSVAQFDLVLNLVESDGRIVGDLDYASALFDPSTAERYCAYLRRVLEEMVRAPQACVAELDILPAEERRRVLVEWNDTARPWPQERTIHSLFEEQLARDPTATAVICDSNTLSYTELHARANQLAHHLRALGVGPDVLVGICMERCPQMVVAVLAVLKSGGAYVPLDPAYPADRLAFILGDTHVSIVLTMANVAQNLPAHLSHTVLLDDDWPTIARRPAIALGPITRAENLAYVIYTSGSTGRPKGVMVEHRNVVSYIDWAREAYGLTPGGEVPVNTSLAFDATVTSFLAPLAAGGAVHLLPEGEEEILRLGELLATHAGLSLVKLTPSHLDALRQLRPEAARVGAAGALVIGGEVLFAHQTDIWRRRAPDVRLINEYGPTEATVGCTTFELRQDRDGMASIPIGRPIANARIYILDGSLRPVPIGVTGEIFIGGAGVARGYLNRPDLTRERFLESPFVAGERLYKSGDLARFLPGGDIEFLGRNDSQVKLRGYRIEPGEIETRLLAHPHIRSAAVIVREDATYTSHDLDREAEPWADRERAVRAQRDEPGDRRLVAYYTATEMLESQALREHVCAELPDYMVPAAFVRLETLPLTPNGKLDRDALPAPEGDAFTHMAYEPPQGAVEERLAAIWSEALHVERVGRQDNFFELGGHSLLAIRVLEGMRRAGLQADIKMLFTSRNLAALAAQAQVAAAATEVPANRITPDCEAITPDLLPLVALTQEEINRIVATVPGGATNVQDIYPLAPLQEGILFHHLLARNGDPYLVWNLIRFDNRETLDRYIVAVNAVIARHDIWRTAVLWEGLPEPVQVVWRHAPLAVEELVLDPALGDITSQLKVRFDPRQYRIDVRRAPMTRLFVAFDPGRDCWVGMSLLHHLVDDNTTLYFFLKEVVHHLAGRAHELAPPVPFRNFIARARSGSTREEQQHFFQQMLGDLEEPTAPFGLLDAHGEGMEVEDSFRELDLGFSMRLRARARVLGISVASLFHVAWGMVLARISGAEKPVFGTVLFGRMHGGEGVHRGLGLMINTLPLRVKLGLSAETCAVQTHRLLAELMRHEHASLALAQRCSLVAPPTPLFTSLLNYRHSTQLADTAVDDGNLKVDGVKFFDGNERSNYPLTLNVDDLGDGFHVNVQIAERFGPESICAMLAQALASLLEALEFRLQTPIAALEVLPAQERQRLLALGAGTGGAHPQDFCIHQRIEAQAACRPDAVAVTLGDRSLTYCELNVHADRLARRLRELGVVPDARVAICVERSFEMIIGLLGILKAGGAYVPFDPAYPLDRLAYMLDDCVPVALLCHAPTRATLSAAMAGVVHKPPVIDIDIDTGVRTDGQQVEVIAASIGLLPNHLAYVIYTSGSTGRPKGVLVEHGNVMRLFAATDTDFSFGAEDVWTLFHSFAFDFSVWEIWGALVHGGRLVVVPQATSRTPAAFYEVICDEGVTILNQTPSAFGALITAQATNNRSHRLRRVVFGGEALEPATLRPWVHDSRNVGTMLVNMYGITETTVHVTYRPLAAADIEQAGVSPIGKPIEDLRLYLLDRYMNPAPIGVAGEIYVGGAGVARGYLKRPDLTRERFLESPFVAGERLYKTGDLGRFLADGNVEFLGRNDFQVKIRGYRIELGEIEARLLAHPQVRSAVVTAREDAAGDKRLIAYYTAEEMLEAGALREHVAARLPDYMVPVAFMYLEALPLTPNGKLDRKALPAPEGEAFALAIYEPAQGALEERLAAIWSEALGVGRVGRQDNFFALGGHSLLAIRVLERMRRAGLQADIKMLFTVRSLAALAQQVRVASAAVAVPANRITAGCEVITPDLLPLIALTQDEIDSIVAAVPGGAANIQDIYPLTPLQRGMLFHHLLEKQADPYIIWSLLSFASRAHLDSFVDATNAVIERHDILRTAFAWEALSEPMQVVWRRSRLQVEEVVLDMADGDVVTQLFARFGAGRYRIDTRNAPLLRLFVSYDSNRDRWQAIYLFHHLVDDATSLQLLTEEIGAYLSGMAQSLPVPLPFRDFAPRSTQRLGDDAKAFFSRMLGPATQTTTTFGLANVYDDGSTAVEFQRDVDCELARRLRQQAVSLGVTPASLFHLAWARVLALASGLEAPAFGTVVAGRMQGGEGVDRVLGLLINTLPVRLDLRGADVRTCALRTHALLAELLQHEHAPLDLAQRLSGVPRGAPLFTAILNYRHTIAASIDLGVAGARAWDGIERLASEERTNYPLYLMVDDLGDGFSLSLQAVAPLDSGQICGLMHDAVDFLVGALERNPSRPMIDLDELALHKVAAPLNEGVPVSSESYEPPAGEVEVALALIWAEVLGVERVGRNDHFFDLGGTSVQLVNVMGRLQAADFGVSLTSLSAAGTLAKMATALGC